MLHTVVGSASTQSCMVVAGDMIWLCCNKIMVGCCHAMYCTATTGPIWLAWRLVTRSGCAAAGIARARWSGGVRCGLVENGEEEEEEGERAALSQSQSFNLMLQKRKRI